MTAVAIHVEDLTKHYESSCAVDHVSFEVDTGLTGALLGANGAGKTTSLAMLLGLLKPSGGVVRVLGTDMQRSRYGRQDRNLSGAMRSGQPGGSSPGGDSGGYKPGRNAQQWPASHGGR